MRHRPIWKSPFLCWLLLGIWMFGTMAVAIALYPRPYSWQHTVISTLSSPRDNPRSYGIACVSLAGTGLFYLAFVRTLRDRLCPFAPRTTAWAGWFLRIGAGALILTAIIVPGHYRLLGLARMHERLAQFSGLAFSLALIGYFRAVLALPADRRGLKLTSSLVTVLPLAIFLFTRIPGWTMWAIGNKEAYQRLSVAAWNDLALWEWLAAGSLYSFLGLILLFIAPSAAPAAPSDQARRAQN